MLQAENNQQSCQNSYYSDKTIFCKLKSSVFSCKIPVLLGKEKRQFWSPVAAKIINDFFWGLVRLLTPKGVLTLLPPPPLYPPPTSNPGAVPVAPQSANIQSDAVSARRAAELWSQRRIFWQSCSALCHAKPFITQPRSFICASELRGGRKTWLWALKEHSQAG